MLKKKCATCGTKYEYELSDAGQIIDCTCGSGVLLDAPPPKPAPPTSPPAKFVAQPAVPLPAPLPIICTECRKRMEIGELFRFEGRIVCRACHRDLTAAAGIAPPPASHPSSAAAQESKRTLCANCDQPIGRLETPHYVGDQVVCAACRQRLNPSPSSPVRRMPGAGEIICPNPHCGFVGTPTRKARGNLVLAIVLFLFFFVPGVLYILFTSGYDYFCPRCQMKLRSEHR